MPGTKSIYSAATADIEIKSYAPRTKWARAYGWKPAGQIKAVVPIGHGGGWIATSNIWDWKFHPDKGLVDKPTADALLNAGVMPLWFEYPIGWQTNKDSRSNMCARFPQIPRVIGRLIQFLKTHAADGLVTGDVAETLPTDASRYWPLTNSACSVMMTWLGLQPDGFLDYDPALRSQSVGPHAYTYPATFGGIFSTDCATDLRRFGKFDATYAGISAKVLPYVGAFGQFHKDTFGNNAIVRTDRYSTVPTSRKAAMSALPAAQVLRPENALFSIFMTNAFQPIDAAYLRSGVTLNVDSGGLTGTTTGAVTATAAGGSSGDLKLVTSDYWYIDGVTGGISGWTGAITLKNSGGSTVGTLNGLANFGAYGDDNRKVHLSKAQALAIADAAGTGPITGLAEPHGAIFAALMERERAAFFSALGRTNIDRYFIGNARAAQLSGDTAAFPYNGLSLPDEIVAHMIARGVPL